MEVTVNIKILLLTIFMMFVSAASSADKLLHETLYKAGSSSNKEHYSTGYDDEVTYNQVRSAFIQSNSNDLELTKHAGLMHRSEITNIKGKRLRFSAFIKTENVQGWAQLYIRIDGHRNKVYKKQEWALLAYAGMYDRPITGTTDWTQYSVVLDVPKRGSNMGFGVFLSGSGKVWLNDFQFEVVGNDVPVTNQLADSDNSN
jgi:hypothetical protein